MKQILLKRSLMAALVLLSVPAFTFAQDDDRDEDEQEDRREVREERREAQRRAEREEREEREERGEKKNVQQIIITRKGDKEDRTVIEIKGDKVTVNGKDASKSDNVTVHLNNLKGMSFHNIGPGRNFNFDFNNDFDGNHISLFSEDANRAMLGVTTDEDDRGAKITAITKESGAAKAGLEVGDVITRIGDDEIEDADDVSKAVRRHKPGDKVRVSVLRNGRERTFTAELSKWKGVRINNLNATIAPPPPPEPRVAPAPHVYSYGYGGRSRLGLSVQDTDDGKGVKVLQVAEESNAAKAGIEKGDIITEINGDEVESTDDVVKAMRDTRNDSNIRLKVLRNGRKKDIEVRIPRNLKSADL
jgi:serine protease Do